MRIEQLSIKTRPIAEVAADLGRSEAATRMLLSRARAALLKAMEHRLDVVTTTQGHVDFVKAL